MDTMIMAQAACVSGQWFTAIIVSLCCFLPSCLPAGQTVDYAGTGMENVVSRQGDTAILRELCNNVKRIGCPATCVRHLAAFSVRASGKEEPSP
ncbi:hypothetical protein Z043_105676 [Scleropages formosus]|uniref:Secreted protein n=1 Tax=Scleropages formosus TaxID=113540 RepID=A0A0P7VNW2_SCLFO|nr:hypothetical protein Z043_105676 [Scleropages formosus]